LAKKKVEKNRVAYNPKLPLWLQPDDVDMSRTVDDEALELAQSEVENVTFLQREAPAVDLEVSFVEAEVNQDAVPALTETLSSQQSTAKESGLNSAYDRLAVPATRKGSLRNGLESGAREPTVNISSEKLEPAEAFEASKEPDIANVVSLRPDNLAPIEADDVAKKDSVDQPRDISPSSDSLPSSDLVNDDARDPMTPDPLIDNVLTNDLSAVDGRVSLDDLDLSETTIEEGDLDIPVLPSRQSVGNISLNRGSDAPLEPSILPSADELNMASSVAILPDASFLLTPPATKRDGVWGAIATLYRGLLSFVSGTLIFIIMLFAALCSGLLFGYLGFDLPF
jgi:hypothetical protein